ncbi:diaminobutyrate--2-oxoglutarate transaminase [Oceanospirillum sanctuarii]|uniref:diaminobutyrate--2-oxoglutarate transaminase n=1 Tax=Oceanospirillum sanctuarii TaxID=1434821 RepID=UPI000A3B71CB|nr:diaminobutyrate--2-oxoglutarate transaminase [Oceanospirillum sanctuarii]
MIFKEYESEVQSYSRSFPVVFTKAKGSKLFDENGNEYLDFLAGAGSLNYGHNNPILKDSLIEYIQNDGVAHGLDMHTEAKAGFLEAFRDIILKPRNLDHKVMFTGPTGANCVEAALKLARKVTGRHNVVSFTNGFHGCTLGALAATGNSHHRGGAGQPLSGVTRLPYDGYLGDNFNTLGLFKKMLKDNSSGLDMPAAVIVEIVQGEGGLNTASAEWLKELSAICKEHGILFIADDIQAGCGRTGTFFSFDQFDIKPDIITLSKSLSAFGLPFAVTLFDRKLDIWKPGEHNGTFRGNNHAFITAKKALETYWADDKFASHIHARSEQLKLALNKICDSYPDLYRKGRGLMQGICCPSGDIADDITSLCFEQKLIIETSGPEGEVVKCFPPLTVTEEEMAQGLKVLEQAFDQYYSAQLELKKAS